MIAPLKKLAEIATSSTLALLLLATLLAPPAQAWGPSAQKLIINKSIDTLPPDVRAFFDASRATLVEHVTDPLSEESTKPTEKHNHYLYLDKYGRFPFTQLPRNYKAAVSKYGKSKLESTGLLPWQVGVYSAKLTEALRLGKWDEARVDAAIPGLVELVALDQRAHRAVDHEDPLGDQRAQQRRPLLAGSRPGDGDVNHRPGRPMWRKTRSAPIAPGGGTVPAKSARVGCRAVDEPGLSGHS